MLKRTLCVLVVVAAVFALATTAAARKTAANYTTDVDAPHSRSPVILFFDDMEGGTGGWTSVDNTATSVPHFHLDAYMAFAGQSWWCGNFDYDADGGYGNSWDDRLVIPTVDLTGATYPILTYAFRHDSETGYDYTYVQAESLGVFVDLNRGYDGRQAWTDIGLYGFILQTYDNPLNARFRFLSDGAWSDEDGLYLSVGGGFMCDMVKVFDYFGGYVYFYDDVEDGVGACIPDVPGAAGDFWHLIDRCCPALSDPHSWWCGDDADTGFVPPMLQNGLFSPLVDISGASACTVHFAAHFAIPTVDNDYCAFYGTAGGSYYGIAAYWGDFGSCDGWGGGAYNIGFDITQFDLPPYSWGGFLWIMYTTDNGCGPAGGGDAGIMIDDVWFEGPLAGSPVEESSWGSIKAMYQ